MLATSNVQVTIDLTNLGLDDEDLHGEVQSLLPQLKDVDGVEDADLVPVETAPKDSKALGGFILGLLNTEVNLAKIKTLFNFLSDRLSNKPIKMVLKAPDGRELNLEASSREEFEFAFQKAQDFLNGTSIKKDD